MSLESSHIGFLCKCEQFFISAYLDAILTCPPLQVEREVAHLAVFRKGGNRNIDASPRR